MNLTARMKENEQPTFELRFPLIAGTLPADHGYVLFSAICTLLPDLRMEEGAIPSLAILPITGQPIGQRRIALHPTSKLVIRLPQGQIPKLLPLAGKTLPMPGNGSIALGAPDIAALAPASSLYSRLVTIKVRDLKESASDYHDAFLTAARRMAAEVGVSSSQLTLLSRRQPVSAEGKIGARADSPWLRRTLSIKHRNIAGYAMLASGLTQEASLALQIHGLGGRRHFGCGVFVNHDRYTLP